MRQHKPPDRPVIPGKMLNPKLDAKLVMRKVVPELAEALIHKCAGENVYVSEIANNRLALVHDVLKTGA